LGGLGQKTTNLRQKRNSRPENQTRKTRARKKGPQKELCPFRHYPQGKVGRPEKKKRSEGLAGEKKKRKWAKNSFISREKGNKDPEICFSAQKKVVAGEERRKCGPAGGETEKKRRGREN